jgi:hypothetical protein
VHDYEGVPVRVADPEDTLAIDALLARKREWHRRDTNRPLTDKVRILLELQRQELPLLAGRFQPFRTKFLTLRVLRGEKQFAAQINDLRLR